MLSENRDSPLPASRSLARSSGTPAVTSIISRESRLRARRALGAQDLLHQPSGGRDGGLPPGEGMPLTMARAGVGWEDYGRSSTVMVSARMATHAQKLACHTPARKP
jgi:hypothetical protein